MAEFEQRWQRLAAAARAAAEPAIGLDPQRRAQLARLRFAVREAPRAYARAERRSLVACAALLCGLCLLLVPCGEPTSAWFAAARAALVALPSELPRPPHPPSASEALARLPDLRALGALAPFPTENQP